MADEGKVEKGEKGERGEKGEKGDRPTREEIREALREELKRSAEEDDELDLSEAEGAWDEEDEEEDRRKVRHLSEARAKREKAGGAWTWIPTAILAVVVLGAFLFDAVKSGKVVLPWRRKSA